MVRYASRSAFLTVYHYVVLEPARKGVDPLSPSASCGRTSLSGGQRSLQANIFSAIFPFFSFVLLLLLSNISLIDFLHSELSLTDQLAAIGSLGSNLCLIVLCYMAEKTPSPLPLPLLHLLPGSLSHLELLLFSFGFLFNPLFCFCFPDRCTLRAKSFAHSAVLLANNTHSHTHAHAESESRGHTHKSQSVKKL